MTRQQIIALSVTAFVALCGLLLMNFARISVGVNLSEWPPVNENEVALVEDEMFFDVIQAEFVPVQSYGEAGPAQNDVIENNNSSPEPTSGMDLSDVGDIGVAPDMQTTEVETSVKQPAPEETKPTGPSKEELEREEARRRASSATSSAFQQSKGSNNTSNTGKTSGDTGSTRGISTSFHGSGTGNVSGGWVMPRYNKVPSTATGSIKVRATIDRQGNVTLVEFIGGEAPASTDGRLRAAIEKEIRSHKFTRHDSNAPEQAKAYITYTFK